MRYWVSGKSRLEVSREKPVVLAKLPYSVLSELRRSAKYAVLSLYTIPKPNSVKLNWGAFAVVFVAFTVMFVLELKIEALYESPRETVLVSKSTTYCFTLKSVSP